MKKNHYLPGGGQWHDDVEAPYFQPDICKFKFPRMPKSEMQKCMSDLVRHNLTVFMVEGDSNGRHNAAAFPNFITNCKNPKEHCDRFVTPPVRTPLWEGRMVQTLCLTILEIVHPDYIASVMWVQCLTPPSHFCFNNAMNILQNPDHCSRDSIG